MTASCRYTPTSGSARRGRVIPVPFGATPDSYYARCCLPIASELATYVRAQEEKVATGSLQASDNWRREIDQSGTILEVPELVFDNVAVPVMKDWEAYEKHLPVRRQRVTEVTYLATRLGRPDGNRPAQCWWGDIRSNERMFIIRQYLNTHPDIENNLNSGFGEYSNFNLDLLVQVNQWYVPWYHDLYDQSVDWDLHAEFMLKCLAEDPRWSKVKILKWPDEAEHLLRTKSTLQALDQEQRDKAELSHATSNRARDIDLSMGEMLKPDFTPFVEELINVSKASASDTIDEGVPGWDRIFTIDRQLQLHKFDDQLCAQLDVQMRDLPQRKKLMEAVAKIKESYEARQQSLFQTQLPSVAEEDESAMAVDAGVGAEQEARKLHRELVSRRSELCYHYYHELSSSHPTLDDVERMWRSHYATRMSTFSQRQDAEERHREVRKRALEAENFQYRHPAKKYKKEVDHWERSSYQRPQQNRWRHSSSSWGSSSWQSRGWSQY